jgi:hypothetical protein
MWSLCYVLCCWVKLVPLLLLPAAAACCSHAHQRPSPLPSLAPLVTSHSAAPPPPKPTHPPPPSTGPLPQVPWPQVARAIVRLDPAALSSAEDVATLQKCLPSPEEKEAFQVGGAGGAYRSKGWYPVVYVTTQQGPVVSV